MDKQTDDIRWYISMLVTIVWPLVIEWLDIKGLFNRRKAKNKDD